MGSTHVWFDLDWFQSANGLDWYGSFLTQSSHKESDPRNKTSCSHYKILSKLTEIFLRRLSMTGSYSVQNGMARHTHGPRTKSWTPEIKSRVHTIDFYRNCLKFFETTQYDW